MTPLKAYNTDHTIKAAITEPSWDLLSSLYTELSGIYYAIAEAQDSGDREAVEELLIQKDNLLPRISQLECSLLFDS